MITELVVPQINNNDQEVVVLRWLVADGAKVTLEQEVVEVETSKSVVALPATAAGYLRQLAAEGGVIAVAQSLGVIGESKDEIAAYVHGKPASSSSPRVEIPPAAEEPVRAKSVESAVPVETAYTFTRFSPAALAYVEKHGLDKASFAGLGLVTVPMIEARLAPPAAPDKKSERLGPAKLAEIAALATVQSSGLDSSLTIYFESAAIRQRLEREGTTHGLILPLIIFELSRLVKQWPKALAYFEAGAIHYRERVDFGIAMDVERGLKVLTLPNVDQLSPAEITEQLWQMSLHYAENRLSPAELQESALTITDLSGFDIAHFRPLINGRQAMILGIGGDATAPNHLMSLTATFDHRVLSGKEVAQLLGALRDRLRDYTPAPAAPAPVCCDRCGIDVQSYYAKFAPDALMQVHVRPDNTQGYLCRRCAAGF